MTKGWKRKDETVALRQTANENEMLSALIPNCKHGAGFAVLASNSDLIGQTAGSICESRVSVAVATRK